VVKDALFEDPYHEIVLIRDVEVFSLREPTCSAFTAASASRSTTPAFATVLASAMIRHRGTASDGVDRSGRT
jgi:hypothetical protein